MGGEFIKESVPADFLLNKTDMEDSENKSYVLVPLNKPLAIHLNLKILQNLLKNVDNKLSFKLLPQNTRIIIELWSMEEVKNFEKISHFVPDHSELIFNDVNYSLIETWKLSITKLNTFTSKEEKAQFLKR